MSNADIPVPDIPALMRDPAHAQDPYPVYRMLLERDRACWLPDEDRTGAGGMWLISRYDEVLRVLRVADEFSNDIKRLVPESDWNIFDHMLLYSDPPDHTRLRALLTAPFATQPVQSLEPRLRALCQSQFDVFRGGGDPDFVAAFALPFPMRVICELMGLPPEDSEQLKQWSIDLTSGLDSTLDGAERERIPQILTDMQHYFETRLAAPGHTSNSVLGLLSEALANQSCSRAEALGQCLLMLIAGHETTVNLISSGVLLLLNHPEACRAVKKDRKLLPGAMAEILRHESPLQRATFRVATRPLRIGGQRVDEGERVSAVIGAANRDPGQFAQPDRFDIYRKPNRHVAFGAGIHRCLGERLALLEGRIAFNLLLDAGLDATLMDPPRWQRRTLFRGLESLRLAWRA